MHSVHDSSPWFLQWDARMSVDLPAIDEEHRHFISLVNALNESILQRHGPDVIRSNMQAIIEDARVHFSHEEELFKEWRYPDIDHHARLHAEIITTLLHLKDRFLNDEATEYEMIDAGLKIRHTLIEHMLTDDMRYRDFNREHAVNKP